MSSSSNELVKLRVTSESEVNKIHQQSTRAAGQLYMETYGCQMNVADSSLVLGQLRQRGAKQTQDAADADTIVINTCAVRERAEERVLARVQELSVHKRRGKDVVIAIVGCMAEHLKERILERAPYVDIVAGPDSYRRLPELIDQTRNQKRGDRDPIVDIKLDKDETYSGLQGLAEGDGVSGFITIQRGCDKFCTFCVVPFTRGRERGASPREILRQVRLYADAGYPEVVLLGQTVNSYRYEDVSFAELLTAVADVDGIERVRFTSPYPVDFRDDVIGAMASNPKICKHVHLPLQSGSDSMLARMRRGYTAGQFLAIATALRAAMPDIAITTDIMCGFSGESDAEHADTLAVMEQVRFDAAFTFLYSERDLTYAAKKLPDDISPELKRSRLQEIIDLQNLHSKAKNTQQIGRVARVLLHSQTKRNPENLLGRTDDFKAVVVKNARSEIGSFVDVEIQHATAASLFGEERT